VFNAINVGWNSESGYPDVGHGASFIMSAEFRDGACPVRAGTFVTYGQTEDQGSPHASDYTQAFSRKDWNRVPFCENEVAAAALESDSVRIGRPSR
jgi:acyl-homoserine-lactone acylase